MSRRLLPTLVDYVVVAINPALIMGLIGSLVYFLIEVFYAGQYPEKLRFSLSCFIFASVLVSRIAIESGSQHAAPFGMALAVVVGIALNTFVDYRGTVVGYFAWIINWGLMALIWWCAHKLTWDCTVIDEKEEAAGRGLLETVGIDPAAGISDEDATKPMTEKSVEAAVPRIEPWRTRWQDLLDPPDRPHTPGVWVVYFSLASLPIFGFGQAFIPATRVVGRRYAFILLCVYVACGLALLLTTSFLAIRRYLRQRRLEMPLTMVGNWLSTGALMIVVLLVLTAVLPRPSPEFAISEIPWQASSEQHQASKVNFGGEGVRDPHAAPDSGVDHSQDLTAEGPQQSGGVDTKGPAGQTGAPSKPGQSSSAGGEKSSTASGSQSPSSGGGSKSSGGSSSQSRQSQDRSQSQPQDQAQSQGQSEPQRQSQSQGQPQSQAQPSQNQPAEQAKGEAGSSQKSEQKSEPAQPPATSQPAANDRPLPGEVQAYPGLHGPMFAGFMATALGILKWMFYGLVVAGVLYALWHYREELLVIVGGWIDAFRQFWRALFSGRHFDEDAPELERLHALRQVSFSDFSDPFARGLADRHGSAELVKYTFAALEVWGREHGTGREPDQTPGEFAAVLGSEIPELAADAQALASLYGRAVYSEAVLPAEYVANLAHLWRYMQVHPPQPAEPIQSAAP